MRQVDKKYFGDVQSGRLNADDSPFAITTNEWVNAENVRSGTTDKGFTGIVESIGGNVELPEPLPFNNLDSVVIGTQTWTSKNLDVSSFANGEAITQATNITEWEDLIASNTPAWAYWEYDKLNASLGKYYNVFAINSLKGLAPKGWHIPSSVEVTALYNFVSIDHPGETGYALREVGTAHWNNPYGTDDYGFSMQGNGILVYGDILYTGVFATGDGSGYFAIFEDSVPDFAINGIGGYADYGYNIRLVKDKYTEVKIGEQVWMKENYDSVHYRNGDLIPEVQDPTEWANLTTGAWCWYNNDEFTYGKYGKMYNVFAIQDPRGFAPEGYRVPSVNDFNELSTYLGGDSIAGGKMKQAGTTNWNSPNTGATNSSGFTALPGGQRSASGGFVQIGTIGFLWTSTKGNIYGNPQYFRNLYYNSSSLASGGVNEADWQTGWNVRLIKDQYITIGSVEDTENNRILYFNYSTSPDRIDKITCLYTDTNTQYDVLYGSQVTGGLNFSKDSLIHSAKMSGNILSWVEGTANEPRKINIESAIKANYINFETDANPYIYPLNFSEITMIKRPPIFTPNIQKQYDSLYLNNFISKLSFEFAFQYEYYDSEISVVSSYSQASRLNYDYQNYNSIRVTMDSNEFIPNTVKIVNVIARISNGILTGSNTALVVKTWNKDNPTDLLEIQNHNSELNSIVLSYIFYNDITGAFLPVDDVIRAFDLVPIFSQTHEVAKSRYFLANNTQGYDTPKQTSLQISLGNTIQTASTTLNMQLLTCSIYGGGAYNSGKVYYSYLVYGTINIGGTISTGYYELTSTIVRTPADPYPFPGAIPLTTSISNLNFRGATESAVFQSIEAETANQFLQPIALANYPPYRRLENIGQLTPSGTTNFNGTYLPYIPVTGISATQNFNVYPQLSSYACGVVFYDYAMRKCGVVKNDSNYTLFNSFSNQVSSIEPHTIDFGEGSSITQYIRPNDKVEIISLILNDTYTVVSVGSTTIIVSESLTDSGFYDGVVNIYRYTPSSPTTPARDFAYSSALSTINWSLDNTNALDEIPEWAYYYTVVKTLNLRTRFFVQGFANLPKYMGKTSAGDWAAVNNVYSAVSALAIGLNTDSLIAAGLGYTYTDGDICLLTRSDNASFRIPVIGQNGNYILLKAQDISSAGNISNYTYVFEIYTPYKTSDQEDYYEMGEIYSILNPKSNTRSYGILNGQFNGDTYLLYRNFGASATYIANAMSPNDLYWRDWESDAGKVNVVTRLGQSVNNTNIVWSDTYITGTQINGSSTFRLGNNTYVPDDCGSINKLQLTSKVQDQGSVMLSLCSAETNSMYLGETQITDSTGAVQFFSGTQNVISTINTMKGNYGCVDPASVVQYRGNVYFLDASNGRWVQYSANGLDNISSIKMSRFWKNWCLKYLSMGKSEIEAFGDRPFVFATVDPSHDELLISIPKLSNTPPQGYLPDYPDMVYPFDILDYEGKTLVYKLGTGAVVQPHWQGAYTFTVENFITLQNRLFTFKNGLVYEHNQPTNIVDQNTFFGDYFPSKIMFTSNILPQLPKVYDNFVSESNLVPNFVYFYNNYPKLQMSDLDETSFVNLEGVWYAVILRNKRVDTGTSYTYDGLLTAEVMRNTNMYVLTEFSPTTEILQLRLLQLGTTISKGHTI